MVLTVQILLTIATLGYSVIPTIFDFSDSHATNPTWTGHARYHVIWQVSSYDLIALLGLYLIWFGDGLWIAAGLALAAYGGFWIALLTRPLYDGVLQDEVNGVPDIHYNVRGRKFAIDANVSLFLPLTLAAVIATALLIAL